jgi:hypothetical protein
MNQIEFLREKLYAVLETGIANEILKVSQELDILILNYMKGQVKASNKTA